MTRTALDKEKWVWAGIATALLFALYFGGRTTPRSGPAPTTALTVSTGTGALSWTGPAPSYSNVGGYVGFGALGEYALGETP